MVLFAIHFIHWPGYDDWFGYEGEVKGSYYEHLDNMLIKIGTTEIKREK
jgi:hypothetical protein